MPRDTRYFDISYNRDTGEIEGRKKEDIPGVDPDKPVTINVSRRDPQTGKRLPAEKVTLPPRGPDDKGFLFSAGLRLMAVDLALELKGPPAFEPIMALADGYGEPGAFPGGYDWSGIRDSSEEAKEAMFAKARELLQDCYGELTAMGLPHLLACDLAGLDPEFNADPERPNEGTSIEGMECPECEQSDAFLINVSTMALATAEGAEQQGDIEWDENNTCMCPECHHEGNVADFMSEPEDKPAPGA